ncbi:GAF domain-containing protein [Clavibacter tessellarius]|uniref:GAF domain-containing protein n=1 Tax=Clavibacter tessellarius TaxID=31965 RepID=UPI003248CF93
MSGGCDARLRAAQAGDARLLRARDGGLRRSAEARRRGVDRRRGPDPDAVLLIGNGPAHGWGVVTHELALTGHLGRAVTARTERPCAVTFIGDETMNVSSALAWVGDHDVAAYDVVVLVLGINDAVRLTRVPVWRERFAELMDALVAGMRPSARILVAGMQPVRSVTPYDSALGGIAQRHARRLDHEAREVVDLTPRASYSSLGAPELEDDRPLGSSRVYRSWAREIADAAAPLLADVREAEGASRAPYSPTEPAYEWAGTARLVEQARHGGSEELQRLAGVAQERFDVDVAVVSLLDGDRLWYAMNTDRLPFSIPRDIAYCATVVEADDALVVPDAQRDPRFAGNPFIDITGMDFYAGYPLHSSDGEPIGTFCLLDRRTRAASSVPMEGLREIALQAETELRRYET